MDWKYYWQYFVKEMLPLLPKFSLNKKYFWILGGCAVFLLLVCMAYSLLVQNQKPLMPIEKEVAKAENKSTVQLNADLVQKIYYSRCGDEEVLHTKAAENLIGLNLNQVQKIYQGWSIGKFTGKEIEMTLTVEGFCREHANNAFIGIKDGYVAVFYGRPSGKPILKEITKINANKLMPQDIEVLKKGMAVQSKEELLQTLEGLQSR